MDFENEAAFYVSLGWKIFPLQPGTKIPFTGSAGVRDATDDAETIAGWHKRAPTSNIAASTGASGLIVIDIDCKPGKPNGFRVLEMLERQRRVFPMTVHSRTRTGGLHLFFRAEKPWPDLHKKKLGPGVDIQTGNLGATLPPSFIDGRKVDDGISGTYEWVRPPIGGALPLLPRWVLDVTKPLPAPRYKPGEMPKGEVASRLAGAIRAVTLAPKGQRNNELNKQAHLIGKLIVEAGLDEATAEAALFEAAKQIGRTHIEARGTIRSGIRAGKAHAGVS